MVLKTQGFLIAGWFFFFFFGGSHGWNDGKSLLRLLLFTHDWKTWTPGVRRKCRLPRNRVRSHHLPSSSTSGVESSGPKFIWKSDHVVSRDEGRVRWSGGRCWLWVHYPWVTIVFLLISKQSRTPCMRVSGLTRCHEQGVFAPICGLILDWPLLPPNLWCHLKDVPGPWKT